MILCDIYWEKVSKHIQKVHRQRCRKVFVFPVMTQQNYQVILFWPKCSKDGHVASRWKAWNIPCVKLIPKSWFDTIQPENPGDYKHSAVFASYTRIISLYGVIRFTLSGYSRFIEFSIKDSICKTKNKQKMSSNCSGDGSQVAHCQRPPWLSTTGQVKDENWCGSIA